MLYVDFLIHYIN